MNSFAFLCKLPSKKLDRKKIDLHINFWSFDKKEPFIDIGLKIDDYKDISSICIIMPFEISLDDIEDLSLIMKEYISISNLIFNENCNLTSSKKDCFGVKIEKKEYEFYSLYNGRNLTTSDIDKRELNIEIDRKNNGFKNLYIRFRIKTPNIEKVLCRDVGNKLAYLKGAFDYTKIIDLKFNKIRNIDNISFYLGKGYNFMKFRKIHFLNIESIGCIVDAFGKNRYSCRTLEKGWINYLPLGTKEDDIKNMLVYHWTHSSRNKVGIDDYGITVKVTSKRTNFKIILFYIGILIAINIATPTVSCVLQSIIDQLRKFLISIGYL